MSLHPPLHRATVSVLALATALAASPALAQQADKPVRSFSLDGITLIAKGKENVTATGGVAVSEEDIEALQPADVSELFSRNSAVAVSGGAGPSKRIHVFGLEQSNLAVTVDGTPQPRTGWHHTGSSVVDPAFLKSVEVEAGAAAADSGFGAAAGAVRYETVGARDLLRDGRTQGGRVGLSYGSNGRGFSGTLAGYGVYQGFDWFAMVHSANGTDYEAANGRTLPGSAPKSKGALVKTGYEFEGHRVELAYEYGKDNADRVIKMNMDLARTDDTYPLKITNNTLRLKYSTTAPTAAWDPQVELYVRRSAYWRPDYQTGARQFNGDMDMETRTIGGVVKNTYQVASGTITAGVDFAYDDYEIDNYSTTTKRYWTTETMQVGAFVQGRFEFANGIDLSTGARFDHHRMTDYNSKRFSDSGGSLNATLSYEFADGYEVFAGASRSWLGYDVGEFGLLHARTDAFRTAPDYKPATATNFKLGLNADQANWTGNITYFDTRLKDLGKYDADPAVFMLVNEDEIRSRGVTMQAAYNWDTGRVGGSFTRADVTRGGEKALPQGGTAMPVGSLATLFVDQAVPQYNLKLGAGLEWANKLSGDYLTQAGFSDQSSYTVVNAYAEWRPASYDNVVVHLNVDNLFDKAYFERSSFAQYDRRQVQPVYAPGRTVTLGVKMDF